MLAVTRRNRETKTLVTVVSAEEAGLDDAPGSRWYTICEDHNVAVSHATKRLARWHSAKPTTWCEECHGELGSN